MSLGTRNPEQLRLAPRLNTSVEEAKKSLDSLRQEVELTKKVNEFLGKNNSELYLETKIDAMYLRPEMPHRRAIYERMFFAQRNGAKIILTAELAKFCKEKPTATDTEIAEKAKEVIDGWLATLAEVDKNKDGKLNYAEIIPRDPAAREFIERVFGTMPFFKAMESNPLFQGLDPNVEKNIPEKIAFVKNHIAKFAETLIDPKTGAPTAGAGRELGQLLQSISLSVVGGKFLKNEDFAKMWNELLKENKTVAAAFAEGEKQTEQNRFGKMLDKTSEQIRRLRMEADKNAAYFLRKEKTNPHGFLLGKYNGIEDIFIYYGSNILLATIGINLAFSGGNLEKILKNPVIWAMGIGVLGAKKYFNPDFMTGTPDNKKIAQAELKDKFKNAKPAVREWAVLFSKSDLNTEAGLLNGKQPLGKMLLEKNRSEITSAELASILKKNAIKPNFEILAGSQEARDLFLFLRACKQRDVSPKSLNA